MHELSETAVAKTKSRETKLREVENHCKKKKGAELPHMLGEWQTLNLTIRYVAVG